MNVIILEELRLIDTLFIHKYVRVMVPEHNEKTRGAAGNDSVHNHHVRLEDIIGNQWRARVHKARSNQNYQGSTYKETNIHAWELPVHVLFVHFKDKQYLLIGKTLQLRMLWLKPIQILLSYLLKYLSPCFSILRPYDLVSLFLKEAPKFGLYTLAMHNTTNILLRVLGHLIDTCLDVRWFHIYVFASDLWFWD